MGLRRSLLIRLSFRTSFGSSSTMKRVKGEGSAIKLNTVPANKKEVGGNSLIVNGIKKKDASIPSKVVTTKYYANRTPDSSFKIKVVFVLKIEIKQIPISIK